MLKFFFFIVTLLINKYTYSRWTQYGYNEYCNFLVPIDTDLKNDWQSIIKREEGSDFTVIGNPKVLLLDNVKKSLYIIGHNGGVSEQMLYEMNRDTGEIISQVKTLEYVGGKGNPVINSIGEVLITKNIRSENLTRVTAYYDGKIKWEVDVKGVSGTFSSVITKNTKPEIFIFVGVEENSNFEKMYTIFGVSVDDKKIIWKDKYKISGVYSEYSISIDHQYNSSLDVVFHLQQGGNNTLYARKCEDGEIITSASLKRQEYYGKVIIIDDTVVVYGYDDPILQGFNKYTLEKIYDSEIPLPSNDYYYNCFNPVTDGKFLYVVCTKSHQYIHSKSTYIYKYEGNSGKLIDQKKLFSRYCFDEFGHYFLKDGRFVIKCGEEGFKIINPKGWSVKDIKLKGCDPDLTGDAVFDNMNTMYVCCNNNHEVLCMAKKL